MKRSMSLTIVAILLMFVGVFPGSSVEMDDLVFYFSLDEGQGDKIKDLSPNKLHVYQVGWTWILHQAQRWDALHSIS